MSDDDIYLALAKELAKPEFSFTGGGGSVKGGVAGGGRLGLDIPLNEDELLRLGLMGGGVRTPNFKDLKATGLDLTYTKGDNEFSAAYNRPMPGSSDLVGGMPMPPPPKFMINYTKRFK